MTMQRITNTTEIDLTLPNGVVIAAGATRSVRAWDRLKLAGGVKAWLSAGALVEAEQSKPKRSRKAKTVASGGSEISD